MPERLSKAPIQKLKKVKKGEPKQARQQRATTRAQISGALHKKEEIEYILNSPELLPTLKRKIKAINRHEGKLQQERVQHYMNQLGESDAYQLLFAIIAGDRDNFEKVPEYYFAIVKLIESCDEIAEYLA